MTGTRKRARTPGKAGRGPDRSRGWPADPAAREQLQRALALGAVASTRDRALLNTRVEYEDEVTGARWVVTLVHPDAADGKAHRVSVLEPLGMALLGLREGQSVDWPLDNGLRRRVRLVRVLSRTDAQARNS
ncbi:MAG TPA: GreA/GreB family elongation factor [Casimicrobiaceae bacterium]|jgi:regulator of nucleoside diphosphate kinase